MRKLLSCVLAALVAGALAGAPAAGKSRSGRTRCASCARTSKGKIARSSRARAQFKRSHPCPSTGRTSGSCPGYVIDHIVPLKRGGADAPANMQWQTKAAARAKDRIE